MYPTKITNIPNVEFGPTLVSSGVAMLQTVKVLHNVRSLDFLVQFQKAFDSTIWWSMFLLFTLIAAILSVIDVKRRRHRINRSGHQLRLILRWFRWFSKLILATLLKRFNFEVKYLKQVLLIGSSILFIVVMQSIATNMLGANLVVVVRNLLSELIELIEASPGTVYVTWLANSVSLSLFRSNQHLMAKKVYEMYANEMTLLNLVQMNTPNSDGRQFNGLAENSENWVLIEDSVSLVAIRPVFCKMFHYVNSNIKMKQVTLKNIGSNDYSYGMNAKLSPDMKQLILST